MALLAKNESSPKEKAIVGMHQAVCCNVVDVGTHEIVYKDSPAKRQHQVVFLWELDQNITESEFAGKPMMVSKKYNFTLFEKGNLSKDIESWTSRKITDEQRKIGIDLETFIGKACTINMIEGDKGYVNVGSILPPMPTNTMQPVCKDIPKWVTKYYNESEEAIAAGTGCPF